MKERFIWLMRKRCYMKKGYIAYIALIIIALMVPFVGMSFWMTTETTENKEMSRWPQLIEDGNYNTDYLEEAGTYFEEHMAFRLQMLTANSAIWGKYSIPVQQTR